MQDYPKIERKPLTISPTALHWLKLNSNFDSRSFAGGFDLKGLSIYIWLALYLVLLLTRRNVHPFILIHVLTELHSR